MGRLSRRFVVICSALFFACAAFISNSGYAFAHGSQVEQQAQLVGNTIQSSGTQQAKNFPLPSWWNGQVCDATHYQANNPNHASSSLLATWNGLEACGPEPQGNSNLDAPVQFVPNPFNTIEYEWECTELVKRYMLLAWGLPSLVANGNQIVSVYLKQFPTDLKEHNNGDHAFPIVGDVMSYTNSNADGHTAIVTNVQITNSSLGDATITTLEQNGDPAKHGVNTHTITNWIIQDNSDGHVTSWLTPQTWRVVSNPNVGVGIFNGVAAVSTNDVWAVGFTGYSPFKTLIEQWNGKSWSVIPSPNIGTSDKLYSVEASSSTDAWAVGYYVDSNGIDQTLTEHWDGTSWSIVASPAIGQSCQANFPCIVLYGVSADSIDDVWAVGTYVNSNGDVLTLTEHWNGTQWSVVSSPNSGGFDWLQSVSALSSTDIWAAGFIGAGSNAYTLIEHWDGTSWSVIPSPSPDNYAELAGIAANSSNDAWAVGYHINQQPYKYETLVEHWDGTGWQVVKSPSQIAYNFLYGVTAVSTDDVWAVGSYDNSSNVARTLVEHWNGIQWNTISSSNSGTGNNVLNSVTAVSGDDIWAVGSAASTLTENHP